MSSAGDAAKPRAGAGHELEAETFRKLYPDEYVYKFLRENTRPDGRTHGRFRRTTVTLGAISTAHGSSLVCIGGTAVICGVKAEVAEPRLDAPGEGYLGTARGIPNIELSPLCSSRFKPGPPSDEQQVLSDRLNMFLKELSVSASPECPAGHLAPARFVDGACACWVLTRRSRSVDLSKLCIEPGKAVWVLYVDVQCLNYDGNVMDAMLAAATTALINGTNVRTFGRWKIWESLRWRLVSLRFQRPVGVAVRLPEARINEETEIVEAEVQRSTPLELRRRIFSATVAVLEGEVHLVDSSDAEDQVALTSITVACDEEGVLCGTWKPGGLPVSPDELGKCIAVAKQRHATWMSLTQKAIGAV
ncbi:MAG: ribosomal protein S5 domain 2-type protein [Olpidium bornovanus]|uniref:Ribosomal RNA-processing protein 43 n=1 Tax=Olpidium bornovanus TaxID=278681 RepID=A0A8H7ZSF0_9FUNG|nr:MAG: ribosomal protein S5 domain 2-type protein [Olpidium bornovanus]